MGDSREGDVERLLGAPCAVHRTPGTGSRTVTMTFLGYDDPPFLGYLEWQNVTICLWTGLWVFQIDFDGPRKSQARSALSSVLGPPEKTERQEVGGLDVFHANLGLQRYTIEGTWDSSESLSLLSLKLIEGPEKMAELIAVSRAKRADRDLRDPPP